MENLRHLIGFCNENNNLLWKGNVNQLQEFLSELFDDHECDISEDSRHSSVTLKLSEYSVRFYTSTETIKIFGEKATVVRETLTKILESVPQNNSEASSSPPLFSITDEEEVSLPTKGNSEYHIIQQQLTFIKEELHLMKSIIFPNTTKSSEGEEVKRLTDELAKVKAEVMDHKRTIQNLQQERENLVCALNIVIKDQNYDRSSSESWAQKTHGHGTSSHTQGNKQNDNASDHSNGEDNDQPWSEVKSKKAKHNGNRKHDNTKTKSKVDESTKNDTDNGNGSNRTNTVILGDSIISKLEGWRMSNNSNRISVKSFSGAKVEDMFHYIKPTLSHSPDKIILHIGTNNLKSDNPDSLCTKIENLCKTVLKECPNTKLGLSEITPRHDYKGASNVREKVNKNLQSFCCANNVEFISHPTLTDDSLNTRGIHLNRKGTALLSKDFKNFVQKN